MHSHSSHSPSQLAEQHNRLQHLWEQYLSAIESGRGEDVCRQLSSEIEMVRSTISALKHDAQLESLTQLQPFERRQAEPQERRQEQRRQQERLRAQRAARERRHTERRHQSQEMLVM